jgi:hypothetical protein
MKKPVRFRTGFFSSAEGKLDGGLESFPSDEFHGLRGLDFDFLAGLRVHTRAGLAVGNLEGAEADQLNVLGFFDACFDGINDGVDGALGVGLAGSEGFLNRGGEFDFVHVFFVGGLSGLGWIPLVRAPKAGAGVKRPQEIFRKKISSTRRVPWLRVREVPQRDRVFREMLEEWVLESGLRKAMSHEQRTVRNRQRVRVLFSRSKLP